MIGLRCFKIYTISVIRNPICRRSLVQVISMPTIMDLKEGMIDKWLKKEGDEFKYGERLCEVTLGGLTLAVDGPEKGYLAKILIQPSKTVPVGTPIAEYTETKEEFTTYRENLRLADQAASLQAEAAEVLEEMSKKPDVTGLLREIKHLIKEGHIKDGSDFAKKLQSLARKGDKELLTVFEASFDGIKLDQESFDVKFFLSNARGLIKDLKDQDSD